MIYAEFAPTGFDCKGLGLPDRQDWIVAPVAQNRDSEALARSNFRVVLASLGGESETVEVHRFGHWANGWFEIILCHPGLEAEVAEWEATLSEYPCADDMDYCELEHEDYLEYWEHGASHDFVRAIKAACELRWDSPILEYLEDCDTESLRDLYESGIPSGDYYRDNYMSSLMESSAKHIGRDGIASFVRKRRNRNLAAN